MSLLLGPKGVIEVTGIVSTQSQYGVVWQGVFQGASAAKGAKEAPVAVKMVLLRSGVHYDKFLDTLVDGHERPVNHVSHHHPLCAAFGLPDTTFHKRKSLTRGQFEWEVKQMKRLAKLDLSPPVYASWLEHDGPFHFAFLITGLCHANGKSVLLKRDYTQREMHLLLAMVTKLHRHRYAHGDLKPSNMGVYLDDKGDIVKFHLLDCNKTRRVRGDMWPLKRHDYGTLQKHLAKNKAARERGNG